MRLYRRKDSKVWWVDHFAGGKRHRNSTGSTKKREAEKIARECVQKLNDHYSVARTEIKLLLAIDSFLEHCQREGLARKTVAGYRQRLRFFGQYHGDVDLSWWDADTAFDRVSEYLSWRVREDQVRSKQQDRLILSAFFNFLRAKRWYKGENPADAKLHLLRRPRRKLKKKRCTTREEDFILRREAENQRLWPLILLCRWAGLRRGEACALYWCDVDLKKGCLDVVGHEGGRKHPRTVWLHPWVVLQLRRLQPGWLPQDGKWPIWPHHADTANDDLAVFCDTFLSRKIGFNDLRASFVTEVFERGMSPKQESQIAGHSPEVAAKHYDESEAKSARAYLPPDPLTEQDKFPNPEDENGAGSGAEVAR